jgi:hypothetical protein
MKPSIESIISAKICNFRQVLQKEMQPLREVVAEIREFDKPCQIFLMAKDSDERFCYDADAYQKLRSVFRYAEWYIAQNSPKKQGSVLVGVIREAIDENDKAGCYVLLAPRVPKGAQ